MKKILYVLFSFLLVGVISTGIFAFNNNNYDVSVNADTITDLTGTSWRYNDTTVLINASSLIFNNIDFTLYLVDGTSYNMHYMKVSQYTGTSNYYCFLTFANYSTTVTNIDLSDLVVIFNFGDTINVSPANYSVYERNDPFYSIKVSLDTIHSFVYSDFDFVLLDYDFSQVSSGNMTFGHTLFNNNNVVLDVDYITFNSGTDLTNTNLIDFVNNNFVSYTPQPSSNFNAPKIDYYYNADGDRFLKLRVYDIDSRFNPTVDTIQVNRDGSSVSFVSEYDAVNNEYFIRLQGDVGGLYEVKLISNTTGYNDSYFSNELQVDYTSFSNVVGFDTYYYNGDYYYLIPTNVGQVVNGEFVSFDYAVIDYFSGVEGESQTNIYRFNGDFENYDITLDSNVDTLPFTNSYTFADTITVGLRDYYILKAPMNSYSYLRFYSTGYEPGEYLPGTTIPTSALNYFLYDVNTNEFNRSSRVIPYYSNGYLRWNNLGDNYVYDVYKDNVLYYTTSLNEYYLPYTGDYYVVSRYSDYVDSLPSSVYDGDYVILQTPVLTLGYRTILWDSVPFATYYDVYLDDLYLLSTNSNVLNVNINGNYKVIARSSNPLYISSDFSNVVLVDSIYNPSTNEYSFYTLVGAVIDTPIHYITSLLSFEIFNINIATLFATLISVAILLYLIRKFKGGV